MISMTCPKCRSRGEVPDEVRGKIIKCPNCGASFGIPGGAKKASGEMKIKRASGEIKIKRPSGELKRPKLPRRRPWLRVALLLLVLAGAGGGGYFAYLQLNPAPASDEVANPAVAQAPQTKPQTEEDRAAAEKKARDDEAAAKKKAADDKAAKKKADEARRIDDERRQKEEERAAAEAKLQRERQEKAEREEKARQERLAKEAAAKALFEKLNPKLTAMPEEVDLAPDKFMGKRLYFEGARIKAGAVERVKDLNRFTVGVTSVRGKYFSRVPLNGMFFSTSDKLALDMQKDMDELEKASGLRIYVEVRQCERKNKQLPECFIFKVETYNRMGQRIQTWEDPEP